MVTRSLRIFSPALLLVFALAASSSMSAQTSESQLQARAEAFVQEYLATTQRIRPDGWASSESLRRWAQEHLERARMQAQTWARIFGSREEMATHTLFMLNADVEQMRGNAALFSTHVLLGSKDTRLSDDLLTVYEDSVGLSNDLFLLVATRIQAQQTQLEAYRAACGNAK